VRFDAGRYNPGDYWTIPARSAFGRDTGEVEWPNDGGTPPRAFPLPPEGIRHRYAPLAVISNFSDQGLQIRDCRQLFAPLTELISLVYVSGDAQVLAAPQLDLTASPRLPVRLPLSLKAGVFNGRIPVDAYVRFSISSGQGRLIDPATGASGANIRVRTDNLGIAACWWNVDTLGSGSQVTHPVQTVVARLLDSNDNPYEMLIYHATLNTAARVAFHPPENCRDLADARDVQRAIEILCERDCCVCTISVRPAMRWEELQFEVDRYRRVELCFAEGDYTAEPTALLFKNHDYVKITGAGDGTRITSSTPDGIFTFSGVKSVIVRDLSLTKTMADTLTACLHANSCKTPTTRRTSSGVPSAS
jgi:hypothetical protein